MPDHGSYWSGEELTRHSVRLMLMNNARPLLLAEARLAEPDGTETFNITGVMMESDGRLVIFIS